MEWIKIEPNTKEESKWLKFTFKRKIKFLVDENLGNHVKEYLCDEGYKAKFVSDVNLRRRDDQEIYQYARKNKLILLTHDRDFLDNKRFPLKCSPGVVILPGAEGKGHLLLKALVWFLYYFGKYGKLLEGSKIVCNEDLTQRWLYNKNGTLEEHIYKVGNGEVFELIGKN